MKHILCFGDSNTWGYMPGLGSRYPENVRWTGVLAEALGADYRIHEDGLNARFSCFDSPFKPFLNGLETLPGVLWAQKPLDLLIISLGTNDLKQHTALEAAMGVEELVAYAQTMDARYPSNTPVFTDGPKILVISPIAIGDTLAQVDPTDELAGRHEESWRFPAVFAGMCRARGVDVLDAQTIAEPSPIDCVHMSPESHRALGLAVAERVRVLLGDA